MTFHSFAGLGGQEAAGRLPTRIGRVFQQSMRQGTMKTARRTGHTIVEILVAIAIIGLLAAIVIPAVMNARQSAARLQCANNLRQLGVGLHAYEEANGSFPPSVLIGGGGFQATIWGAHVLLLSHVGEQNLYDEINRNVYAASSPQENGTAMRRTPDLYLCPSDGTPRNEVRPQFPPTAFYNYSICVGDGFAVAPDAVVTDETEFMANGLFTAPRGVRTADVADGLSRTAAFGERIHGRPDVLVPETDSAWTPRIDSTYLIEVSPATPQTAYETCRTLAGPRGGLPNNDNWFTDVGYTHQSTPNQTSCWPNLPVGSFNGSLTASSAHAGGVNVLLADGHVDFVADAVDLQVWRAAATRSGGETTAGL